MKQTVENLKINPDDLIKYVLAIKDDETTGECLDLDTLFAFINKDMDDYQFQQTICHLNTCPDCFYRWSEIVSELKEYENDTIKNKIFTKPFAFADDYKYVFALAACIIICISIYLWPENIETLINDSYKIVYVSHIDYQWDPFESFQKNHSLSFVPSNQMDQDYQAFVSGVISGEQFFSHAKEFQLSTKDSNNIYFQTGRWYFLIKTICNNNKTFSKEFWNKQSLIVSKLINNKSNPLKSVCTQTLNTIYTILQQQSESSFPKCCHEIMTALDDLVFILKQ